MITCLHVVRKDLFDEKEEHEVHNEKQANHRASLERLGVGEQVEGKSSHKVVPLL